MTVARTTLLALCLSAAACGPPPPVTYAHLLEQAASWAAAAQAAVDARRSGAAPAAFATDLFVHAVQELRTIETSIQSLEIDTSRRAAAADACRAIAAALRDAAQGSLPDPAVLQRAELRARALAAEARGPARR